MLTMTPEIQRIIDLAHKLEFCETIEERNKLLSEMKALLAFFQPVQVKPLYEMTYLQGMWRIFQSSDNRVIFSHSSEAYTKTILENYNK